MSQAKHSYDAAIDYAYGDGITARTVGRPFLDGIKITDLILRNEWEAGWKHEDRIMRCSDD